MPGHPQRDLSNFAAVLPYASELFGIYQPLIGWKSKRMAEKLGGKPDLLTVSLNALGAQLVPASSFRPAEGCEAQIDLRSASPGGIVKRRFDSLVLEAVSARLPGAGRHFEPNWEEVAGREFLDAVLAEQVAPAYSQQYAEQCSALQQQEANSPRGTSPSLEGLKNAFEANLRRESSLAGALILLGEHRKYDELKRIFYDVQDRSVLVGQALDLFSAGSSAEAALGVETLDPRNRDHLAGIALSPISVVHLFRQYFFELDTFLGSPVGHVWLSPGSTVELIEVQTRRSLVEKIFESSSETLTRTEIETTEQDELSDAVKEDNKQDIKFGASVTATYGTVSGTASFDYANSQSRAREETHRKMRQQTAKLSTEIRKNYKSTFRTVTETTDTSSKRYLLANAGDTLINYELRRKMRQVGVQVQDVGSYLCWQTYVDRPGEELGIAKLVHIAKPPELSGMTAPDELPLMEPFIETKTATLLFESVSNDADNEGEVYRDGVEVDNSEVMGKVERIRADFTQEFVCPRSGYILTNVEFDSGGQPVSASLLGDITNADNKASFVLHLDTVDFQGNPSIQVNLALHWTPAPGANDPIAAANEEARKSFKAKEAAEYEKAFVESARERVKLSHSIRPRPSEELREEERIVVYRKLIHELLLNGVTTPDDRTRHAVSELLDSIFDVDKMLYFVAPEWWRPRATSFTQQLEPKQAAPKSSSGPDRPGYRSFAHEIVERAAKFAAKAAPGRLRASTVGWGGVDDLRRDNYYITEDSEPAKFGSSLGWLLQLDGDNMRNAFLNAPWVKAVIPIRPGKEEAAINWLKGVEGFNGIGKDDLYRTSNEKEKDLSGKPLDGQPMIDVISDLARRIEQKHEAGMATGKYPIASDVSDPAMVDDDTTVTSTPIDRVYEHGFYPLKDSFRVQPGGDFEIFDQWLEVLPTDQVVPVEVRYDAKTGRQV